MEIVFVEYKVFPEKRDAYLSWVKQIRFQHPRMTHYEASDQASLFVELWLNVGEEEYRSFKTARLHNPAAPWSELAEFVPGGLEKVHVWHFRSTRV
ncbi:hypothetical protein [Paenibacillus ginsengarvi]|uniref:Antibiotic biosynthesis monooxygenase n=1 Tax=Paenibacillus ginsengarvi TaxID=400777 RepID=A0A3B0AUH0_9BACL|nr:hypothetical protein [Paenibacillus ginsengarvi]RKN62886.1 hypothetical protein D7M11_34715 [Paenibacillus ginsengarvi]